MCLSYFTDKFLRENIDSFDEFAKSSIIQEFEERDYWMKYDEIENDEIENNKVEDNEVEENKIEEVKVRDNINIDYSRWNMSKEVEDYFSRNKFEEPFFEIVFDGKKMWLTRLQPIFD